MYARLYKPQSFVAKRHFVNHISAALGKHGRVFMFWQNFKQALAAAVPCVSTAHCSLRGLNNWEQNQYSETPGVCACRL
jgi:hypothetical protein